MVEYPSKSRCTFNLRNQSLLKLLVVEYLYFVGIKVGFLFVCFFFIFYFDVFLFFFLIFRNLKVCFIC